MKQSIFSSQTGFARFMSMLADILIIGILWIILCLPVVTAGTSTIAAYYAMAKVVRYGVGSPAKEFFHGFKVNIKQSIVMNILFVIAAALVVIDCYYTWNNRSTVNDAMFLVMCLVGFIVLSVAIYFCVLMSRFSKTVMQFLRDAFILAFRYLYITVGIIVVMTGLIVLIYLMPWSIAYFPGLFMFGLTYPMEWILHKIMPKPEEGSEEASRWYYGSGKVLELSEEELRIVREKKEQKAKERQQKKKTAGHYIDRKNKK